MGRRLILLVPLFLLNSPLDINGQSGPRPRSPGGGSSGRGADAVEVFSLGGRVMFSGKLTPAVRVRVRLLTTSGTMMGMTFTDERGQFEFQGLGRGVYRVEVSEEGYHPIQERMDLHLGTRTDAVLMLEPTGDNKTLPPGGKLSVQELRIPPKALEAFQKGARELYDQKNPAGSEAHFRKAIELHSEYDQAYVQLAVAHVQQGEFADALRVLQAAVSKNEKNGPAFGLLGTVYNQQGDSEKAVPALQRALELNGPGWQVHFELGKGLLQLGRMDEAYEHASKAHDLRADVPGPHLLLYNLHILRGEHELALKQLEEFLRLHPDHALAPDLRKKQGELRRTVAGKQP
jgi:thioredoxin-like negative regulator of GroEL